MTSIRTTRQNVNRNTTTLPRCVRRSKRKKYKYIYKNRPNLRSFTNLLVDVSYIYWYAWRKGGLMSMDYIVGQHVQRGSDECVANSPTAAKSNHTQNAKSWSLYVIFIRWIFTFIRKTVLPRMKRLYRVKINFKKPVGIVTLIYNGYGEMCSQCFSA